MIDTLAQGINADETVEQVVKVSDAFATNICHRILAQIDLSNGETWLELESHADLPVIGMGAKVITETGKKVPVCGFTDEHGGPIQVSVVNGMVAYDCGYSGNSYALHLCNYIYIPPMKNHL